MRREPTAVTSGNGGGEFEFILIITKIHGERLSRAGERKRLNIRVIYPAGIQFFTAKIAFIETPQLIAGERILVKDLSPAQDAWVCLLL